MELESLIESAAVRARGALQASGEAVQPKASSERFSSGRSKINLESADGADRRRLFFTNKKVA
jgi:hypothetical protein